MKIKKHNSRILIILASVTAALFLAGCAEMQVANTKSQLSAAGFRVRTPETPKQKEIYAALPPYHVERATYKGKVFYVFKDERDGVAYVGREPEYQRYKQLCIQQQIAQDYYMAAQMNSYYARGWYGAWGPRGMWWWGKPLALDHVWTLDSRKINIRDRWRISQVNGKRSMMREDERLTAFMKLEATIRTLAGRVAPTALKIRLTVQRWLHPTSLCTGRAIEMQRIEKVKLRPR